MTVGWRWQRVILATSLALFAAGMFPACQREPAPAPSKPSPALTGLPITIALLPERNIFEQKKRYQPLQEYLSAAIGRPVAFKLLDSYQLIFAEIIEHRIDGAFFGSMNGAIAQIRGGGEMLARPVDLEGASTYSSVLFTREGSGITKDPRTWRGRRVALVDRVTTAGYLVPLSLLRRTGYRGELERYFAHVTYAGSHDAAILAVFNKEADFGACKNTVYNDYLRHHPDVRREMTILDVSAQVPANALGVHPDLDPELRRALRGALLGMDSREDGQRVLRHFGAQRFVETNLSDYEPVFAMARLAGVDLATLTLSENRQEPGDPDRAQTPQPRPRAGD